MSAPKVDVRWSALVLAALAVGAASVSIAPSLGYDSWGWMTWGRELLAGTLNTRSGPSWKPGPSIAAAVISMVTTKHEPAAWLALVRAAALVSLAVTFVATRELAVRTLGVAEAPAADEDGPASNAARTGLVGSGRTDRSITFGAVIATLLVATSADLVKTATYGSSEPFLVLGVVTALLLHLRGRSLGVIASLALTGLTRPEAWVICGLYALTLLPHAGLRIRAAAIGGTLAAPVVWLAVDWVGSGSLSQSASTAEHLTAGSAARAAFPAGEVFLRGSGTLIFPGALLVVGAVVWAVRRRDRLLLMLTAACLLWTAMIAVQAELGLSGDRRYQAGCAAIMSVVAGVGVARLIGWLGERGDARAATAVAGGLLAVVVGFSAVPLRTDARELSVSREKDRQLHELRRAVAALGGPPRVLARGTPVVNPWIQTALAWTLDAPIPRVQAAWSSTPRNPRWAPPAVLFIAPRHYAGTRPAIPSGARTHALLREGRWQVLEAR